MSTDWLKEYPSRRSIRLQGYDYSQPGAYFVTIVTHARSMLLGDVNKGTMVLNGLGEAAAESWGWLTTAFQHVRLDEWVVMPNHVHGIIVLVEDGTWAGDSRAAPTARPGRFAAFVDPSQAKRAALPQIVGAFKTVAGQRIDQIRRTPGVPVWQRGYYDHVVRGEVELKRIRGYLVGNPGKWEEDEENPHRRGWEIRQ